MTPTATDRNSIVKWGAYILRRDDCLIRHGANSIRRDLRDKRGLHFEVKASFSHEKEAFLLHLT